MAAEAAVGGTGLRAARLVTTAIEETWGDDGAELRFLGEWCRRPQREAAWRARAHSVVPYHWDDRAKLARDYNDLEAFHARLLTSLTSALNDLHGVDYDARQWQLIIDPWLLSYIGTLFDRWESVGMAFAEGQSFEMIVLDNGAGPSAPFSHTEFIEACLDDDWNQRMCEVIVSARFPDRVRRTSITLSRAQAASSPAPRRSSRARELARRAAHAVDRALASLTRQGDVVFLSPYFNMRAFVRLSLALRQVPRLYLDEFGAVDGGLAPSQVLDDATRASLPIVCEARTEFEAFVMSRIARDLPESVVEGFAALREHARRIPLRPRTVVTASYHWYHVGFKAWMAERVGAGTRLVILEHGGSLPAPKYQFWFEENIGDVRGLWYRPYHPRQVQLPPSKLIDRYPRRPSRSGRDLSIIGNDGARYVHRIHFNPFSAQFRVAADDTLRFVDALAPDVELAARYKPYPSGAWGWDAADRLEARLGSARMLRGVTIDQVFGRARLIVCTYPDTTFAEAMTTGRPTVLFYNPTYYEMHPIAHPLLEALLDARIVFHEPAAAAAHVNAIWGDPWAWWESEPVRAVRERFRREAAAVGDDWLDRWVAFLREELPARAQ